MLLLRVQFDQKIPLSLHMEDYGHKYTHNMPQFVRSLSSKKELINGFANRSCRKSRLFVHFDAAPLRDYKIPNFGIRDSKRIQVEIHVKFF